MSWSINAAGKAQDVKESFAKKIEHQLAQPRTEAEKQIIAAHGAAVAAVCDAAQTSEVVIIAESNGHLTQESGGNADLKIRRLWD